MAFFSPGLAQLQPLEPPQAATEAEDVAEAKVEEMEEVEVEGWVAQRHFCGGGFICFCWMKT